MMYGGYTILNKYEELKQQIAQKRKNNKQRQKNNWKNAQSNSFNRIQKANLLFNPFTRKVMVISLAIAGLYAINSTFKLSQQIYSLINNYFSDPIMKAIKSTLLQDVERRIYSIFHKSQQSSNSNFANQYFLSELSMIQKSLSCNNSPKIISKQMCNDFELWPITIGPRNQTVFISKQGHAVKFEERCKIKILGLKFIGSKSSEILEYENTLKELANNIEKVSMEQSCKTINMVNRMLMDKEKYAYICSQCVRKSNQIYNKIIFRIRLEKQNAEKRKIKTEYFVSL